MARRRARATPFGYGLRSDRAPRRRRGDMAEMLTDAELARAARLEDARHGDRRQRSHERGGQEQPAARQQARTAQLVEPAREEPGHAGHRA